MIKPKQTSKDPTIKLILAGSAKKQLGKKHFCNSHCAFKGDEAFEFSYHKRFMDLPSTLFRQLSIIIGKSAHTISHRIKVMKCRSLAKDFFLSTKILNRTRLNKHTLLSEPKLNPLYHLWGTPKWHKWWK